MAEFRTTLTGYSFDKKVRDQMEKDFLNGKEFSIEQYDKDSIDKQKDIGIDLPSVSMIHAYPDEIGYVALSLHGFELDFGSDGQGSKTTTNQYVSIPRIVSDVRHGKHFSPYYKDVKAVMTGPLTLALRSNNQYYDNFDELVYAITMAYHTEINHLQNAGIKNVQFNEFGIFSNPSKENLERLTRIYSCLDYPAIKKFIAFYFGDPSVVMPIADRINADVIQFDVFEHNNYLSVIKNIEKLRGKEIVLGLLDSLQYTNDDLDQALIKAADFSDSFGPENVWLSANGDLTIRGPKFAETKAKNLVNISNSLRGL